MDILRSLWLFTFFFSVICTQEKLIGNDNAIYTFNKEEFKKRKFLGEGTYGLVVPGKKKPQNSDDQIDVALKFEKIVDGEESTVIDEAKIYPVVQGHKSIPKFHALLKYDEYDVLIVDLLGRDLSKLEEDLQQFSVKTTMMIGLQMLDVIEYIHSKGVIHSDIKPENIAVGLKNDSNIYLFDFGLASCYTEQGSHIDEGDEGGFTGTPRYCSAYATNHDILSRRDDIESLAYMLISFVEGVEMCSTLRKLLKQGVKSEEQIREQLTKKSTKFTFSQFLMHAFSLKFQKEPNYKFLNKLLLKQLVKDKEIKDLKFDWVIHREKI